MDFAVRVIGDEAVHEVEKLDAAATRVVRRPDLAGGDVERGKQRRGAMPPVFVALPGQRAAIGDLCETPCRGG
jgi:hypothetical protein